MTTTNPLDMLRIEYGGRTLAIPARLVLAIDRVLRHCLTDADWLEVYPVEDEAGEWGFEASLAAYDVFGDGTALGIGATPWEAILALAEKLEETP